MIRVTGTQSRPGRTGETMSLQQKIADALTDLKGTMAAVPTTASCMADGVSVDVDFTAVESLGCAFRDLRMAGARLEMMPLERLQEWAQNVCRRVTYLLEPLGVLELDAEAQTVLARSTPPSKSSGQTAFYEMLVAAPGALSLRRFTWAAGSNERQSCDIQTTREALLKLVDDLVAALPPVADEA